MGHESVIAGVANDHKDGGGSNDDRMLGGSGRAWLIAAAFARHRAVVFGSTDERPSTERQRSAGVGNPRSYRSFPHLGAPPAPSGRALSFAGNGNAAF